jgi:hypothetical protein
MIQTIFPIKILVKDYEFSDEWNSTVSAFIRYHFTKAVEAKGSYEAAADEDISVFSEEHMTAYPELKELYNIFIDGFYELSQASKIETEEPLTRDNIAFKLSNDLGRLPLMRTGDYKTLHTHTETNAYGIFYISDVNNEKDGGELVLHDPSFNNLRYFTSKKTLSIPTKKNRLIIAPSNIWHEVTRYIGQDERLAIVLNLNV